MGCLLCLFVWFKSDWFCLDDNDVVFLVFCGCIDSDNDVLFKWKIIDVVGFDWLFNWYVVIDIFIGFI